MTMKYTKQIIDLAKAIAHAEGFGADPNNVPTRAHNPGDLKIPGWKGETTGKEGITVFPDDETGWEHLYNQLNYISSGSSRVYNPKMTFAQFAQEWTDTQELNWLDNVLAVLTNLGYTVDIYTTLGVYFNQIARVMS